MFGHSVLVALTGLLFMACGGTLAQAARVLGPTYHTRVSADWRLRWFFGGLSLFFFVRGGSFLFPGRLLSLSQMSVFATMEAAAILALSVYILDTIMRERSPPPWSVQFLRLLAVCGWDKASLGVAFNTPPAIMGDVIPAPSPDDDRSLRWVVRISAAVVILTIAMILVVDSVGAAS